MKKTKFIVFISILMLMIVFPLITRASQINPDSYSKPQVYSSLMGDFESYGASIAAVVQVVGTIVSVGTLIIIGIRYIIGSTDEKAEYKERMIPYIIGAVLLFGASNVVNIIFEMFY